MDGPFYIDSRAPHISADVAAVTLAATAKALIPIANIPVLGSNYFSYIGKAVRITLHGRITTGATPGNGTFSLYWGNGTDANGTALASSGAATLVANQTNLSWKMMLIARCRALGATGALMVVGSVTYNSAVVAANEIMIPASAPVQTTVDLTAANVLSPQYLRSGSTAESMQVHDVLYEALN
jgi:hypothetical protein